ncbi:hypothetical protein ACFYTC_48575 [Actinomadura nitritigenes]|jgi:hypothetical protein|uniref:hypothetical protein n=1 Tax=Actinomadura nitritigenes TaxID=134602 RepID=UPI0036A158C0
MEEIPDSGDGDDTATYVDLMRQTRTIHRQLRRSGLLTSRQLMEEWDTVEAAIYVALDTTEDRSGRAVGRAALNAARELQAKWLPADQPPEAGQQSSP